METCTHLQVLLGFLSDVVYSDTGASIAHNFGTRGKQIVSVESPVRIWRSGTLYYESTAGVDASVKVQRVDMKLLDS